MSLHERIVYDSTDECPYLDGEISRTPLRWQVTPPTLEDFDVSLSEGDRRVGRMLYRTDCPTCSSCEPIRVPVHLFKRSKSMRKVWNKNQDLRVKIVPTECTKEKLKMYNRHKFERGLAKNETALTKSGYDNWFVNSCAQTLEFQYFIEDKMICVSVLDVGKEDVSSVYVFFDPDYSDRSMGTFSALFEIEWMRTQKLRYYYLGLYVSGCSHLNYKGKYFPHDRLFDGVWHRFENRATIKEQSVTVPHQESISSFDVK